MRRATFVPSFGGCTPPKRDAVETKVSKEVLQALADAHPAGGSFVVTRVSVGPSIGSSASSSSRLGPP